MILSLVVSCRCSIIGLPVLVEHNMLVVLCLGLYLMCIYNWTSRGNRVLSLFNLFILYSLFSNLGQSLLFLFDIPVEFLSLYEFSSLSDINRMLTFQILCISGLNLGVSLYLRKQSRCISIKGLTQAYHQVRTAPYSDTHLILDILFVVSVGVVMFYAIKMLLLRQIVDYGTFYQEKASWGNMLTDIFQLLYLVLSLYYISKKRYVAFISIINVALLFVFMIVGARSIALRYLCLLIIFIPFIYPNLFKKAYIPIWVLVSFTFIGSLGVISSIRTSAIGTVTFGFQEGLLASIYEMISEMGMSARTSVLTMEAVDFGFPHHQTILVTLINAFVPFVSELSFMKSQALMCSTWISEYAHSFHSGLGYSFIAEMYLNFGWMGWAFMILYGYFIAFAENYSYKHLFDKNNILSIFLLSFLTRQVFYARGEFAIIGGTLRILVYFAIIVFIWRNLQKSKSIKI